MLDARSAVTAKSPPLVPDEAIDRVHLFRMTLGDHSLETEILHLFDRQAALLLDRMRQAAPSAVAALAHTLDGSARGIGAWRVATAAQAVELAVSSHTDAVAAIQVLIAATEDALEAIARILRAQDGSAR